MKKYILALLILFIGSVGALHAQGIEFSHANWNDIKAQAKNEHKLIFLDFYTVWCSPCKKMAMEVFPLPEAGDFFNKHFINVKVDAEKGEGKDLAKTFRPTGYPTLVFTDADGKQLYRTGGAESAAELIKYGKIALNPQEDYERLKEKYDKNVLGKEDRKDNILHKIYEGFVGTVVDVFSNQKKDQFATKVPFEGSLKNPNTNIWYSISHILQNAFIRALVPNIDDQINIGSVNEKTPEKKTFLQKVFGKKDSKDKKDKSKKQDEKKEKK